MPLGAMLVEAETGSVLRGVDRWQRDRLYKSMVVQDSLASFMPASCGLLICTIFARCADVEKRVGGSFVTGLQDKAEGRKHSLKLFSAM